MNADHRVLPDSEFEPVDEARLAAAINAVQLMSNAEFVDAAETIGLRVTSSGPILADYPVTAPHSFDPDAIVWMDPPPKGDIRGKIADEFVAQLKANPGRWALYPHRMSTAWSSGLVRRYPGLRRQIRNQKHEADDKIRADIYLMWPEDVTS
jgi:hypothetical protein